MCILIYIKKENFGVLRDVDELMHHIPNENCETIYDYSKVGNKQYIKNMGFF